MLPIFIFTVATAVVRPCTVMKKYKMKRRDHFSGIPYAADGISMFVLHTTTVARRIGLRHYHIKMDTLTQCDILRHFPALSPQEKATREHRKPTILNNLDFRNLEKCSINHRENGTLVGKIRRNITAAFSVAVPHVRSSGGNSRSRSSNIT